MDRRKRNKKKQNSIENFFNFFARELLRDAFFEKILLFSETKH
ncbi:hypothetical protein HMPREF9088_1554 [Enterococcus italicus DSM 15952]|uniref:Uncharacterized protein n=1 Tax=Enterococcus italicus (strain DSM 15952 / CCUG 50447 / LMG 22039 / TP 1.5) TaxID=888064 RepID=E6LGR4_ENTI1|nr:hypothetical protein HMPREF9088_1554 [Enterococcus italicus DSM 15952]OJG59634.1 intercellular adhesion regulator [Enterococcus italicus DSM 15952]